MNNLKELLALGEPIFLQIDEAVKAKDYDKAYSLLNSPQPVEWQIPLISDATGLQYFHNDIELIEGICDRVFHFYHYKMMQPILTPTKSGIVITIRTKVFFGWDREKYALYGVSTEFVTNPKMLPLATPKTASMSFKNGIKKAGDLLGKSLNRNLENVAIETVFSVPPEPSKSDFEQNISSCKTIEDLSAYKKDLTSGQMSIYMKKLKELTSRI